MARSPMPPPPTTPAMAEYDRKLTASTVSASTRPERASRSEEHTSELQSPCNLVCRLLLEKKNHTAHLQAPLNLLSCIRRKVYYSTFSQPHLALHSSALLASLVYSRHVVTTRTPLRSALRA